MVTQGVFLAISAAIIAVTLVYTYTRYADLPERIPVHFGLTPVPDRYGPKAMAWFMPAVQVAIGVNACYIAAAASVSAAGRAAYIPLVILGCVLATLLAAQQLIIETALNGPSSTCYRRFWMIFAGTLCAGLIVPVLFSR